MDTLYKSPVETKINEKNETSKYHWRSTRRSEYEEVAEIIPCFRTCHINNNADRNPLEIIRNLNDGHVIYPYIYGWVRNKPKWITELENDKGVVETNDLKQSRMRKIKTINRFCDRYEPLYRKKEVSLLIFTFTRANYARLGIRTMLDVLKKRLKALKWSLRGYLWVLEVKKNDNMAGGYHVHYHLIIATDRVGVQTIPEELKL
ncbi:MAG: hypothetical protein U9O96_04095, partial [Candidatus Thermoplasmatota archaeon]|nr:hypothetical protein [Candidatus Thermoplasmatota archaeon]